MDTDDKHLVTYPSSFPKGYGFFGLRGRFQMERALNGEHHFDYFLRVDEDGYLCVDSLLATFLSLPQQRFLVSGRFHCDPEKARMDENFMLLSRDAVKYFIDGWANGSLPFHGDSTLALNVGTQLARLHTTHGWTFQSEPLRIRWDEPIKDTDSCNTHLWFHHLTQHQRRVMHTKVTSTIRPGGVLNNTGCGWPDGLPSFKNLKSVQYHRGHRGQTLTHDFRVPHSISGKES